MKDRTHRLYEAFAIALQQSQRIDIPEDVRQQFTGIVNLLWDVVRKGPEESGEIPEPKVIAHIRGLNKLVYKTCSRDDVAGLGYHLGQAAIAYQTVENDGYFDMFVSEKYHDYACMVRDRWLGTQSRVKG